MKQSDKHQRKANKAALMALLLFLLAVGDAAWLWGLGLGTKYEALATGLAVLVFLFASILATGQLLDCLYHHKRMKQERRLEALRAVRPKL